MDCKVGQYARGYNLDYEKWVLGKITAKDGNCLELNETYWVVKGYKREIKTADNIEDLLIVGDIVHYENSYGEKKQFILDCQAAINIIKYQIGMWKHKITAIELHENRVIQEVKE